MKIILASASPRRQEILKMLGLDFEIIKSDIDENIECSGANELVNNLSRLKAEDVFNKTGKPENALIIAADTVVCKDNIIYGKPKDKQNARQMLESLSDCEHSVITGISLILNGKTLSKSCTTKVYFDKISENELIKYINTSSPYDKAGAYAIQEYPAIWIKRIDGCYHNVVGFPVNTFRNMLFELGIEYLLQ